MKLNKYQQIAASHRDGPALVLAGPGSGKTAVITQRAKRLVDSGIRPESILVITFTRNAASEMRARFEKLVDYPPPSVTFGTFHSVFYNILCHEAGLTAHNIATDEIRYQIIKETLLKISKKDDDDAGFINGVLDEISAIKASDRTNSYMPKSTSLEEFKTLYRAYSIELKRRRLVDFDDMILLTKKLFEQKMSTRGDWADRYQYIMVDEFQDVNASQYEAVKLLASPLNNLFVVGDDDQTIYGFRGSSPDIMQRFPIDFEGCKRVTLSINYRSTPQIVGLASKLIKNNKVRYDKKLITPNEPSELPLIKTFEDVDAENRFIADNINRYHKAGIAYQDMAILYRTNRSSRAIIELLKKEDIPIAIDNEGINIYEHWIAEDIYAYLRIIEGSINREDYVRIINRPARNIRREGFASNEINLRQMILKSKSHGEKEELKRLYFLISKAKKLSTFASINYILKAIGYEKYLISYAKKHAIDVDELLAITDELLDSAKDFAKISEWFIWINEAKNFALPSSEHYGDAVRISTMHKSKGLEYEVVFIPDVNEGLVPYRLAKLDKEIEEERRLLYVGITRAKSRLFILHTKSRYNKPQLPSRFIREIIEN